MYSLAVSHINDMVPEDAFVGSAAAFLFVSGIGLVAGPPIVSAAIDQFGSEAYWITLGSFYAPVALFAVYRVVNFARRPEEPYIPTPVRVSPLFAEIMDEDHQADRPADQPNR